VTIQTERPVPDPERRPLRDKTIVLGVGGSISAYKAADLCSKLVQDGARVLPILTRGALRFVGAATFNGLSHEPVATDGFDEPFGPAEIAHLRYAELADLFVIAPASADLMARMAAGLSDDMLTSALLANVSRPVLVCPAMNADMWAHPATQANRRTLEARGCRFLDPGVGRLAEGIVGAGRLAEPTDIVRAVREILLPMRDLAGLHVLITAGPTREAIDPVRYLTNRSSGKMGYAIAEAAGARGARVTLVSGPVTLPPPPASKLSSRSRAPPTCSPSASNRRQRPTS
jgi:phosphopantothenoylcysteine decarboxylase/phosphopantothenate--cysteine ligase